MKHRQRVLFSCVGTTDPVRGQRDGGLMHIARHYRPDAICIFLSRAMEKNIPRYETMRSVIQEKWNYAPEIFYYKSGIEDPSNLDDLDKPVRDAFSDLHNRYPDAEILINLSSGTPQMEILLSQMALSPEYRTVGIQVKNPEHAAGTTNRTNHPQYDLEYELRNNLDDQPEAENRCVKPRLFAIRREQAWRETKALFRRGDYAAIVNREEPLLPPELTGIVRHLHERELLRGKSARTAAADLPAELDLYPGPPEAEEEYWKITDYWLMMKNLLRSERYADFLLRLSVLTLYLEERLLKTRLAEQGIAYEELMVPAATGKGKEMSMEALRERLPALYERLCADMEKENGKRPFNARNVYLYSRLLRALQLPRKDITFFNSCEGLTGKRNDLAHRLDAVTAEEFRGMAHMNAETFIQKMERAIAFVYPVCDSQVFSVHERCAKYLEEHR